MEKNDNCQFCNDPMVELRCNKHTDSNSYIRFEDGDMFKDGKTRLYFSGKVELAYFDILYCPMCGKKID